MFVQENCYEVKEEYKADPIIYYVNDYADSLYIGSFCHYALKDEYGYDISLYSNTPLEQAMFSSALPYNDDMLHFLDHFGPMLHPWNYYDEYTTGYGPHRCLYMQYETKVRINEAFETNILPLGQMAEDQFLPLDEDPCLEYWDTGVCAVCKIGAIRIYIKEAINLSATD